MKPQDHANFLLFDLKNIPVKFQAIADTSYDGLEILQSWHSCWAQALEAELQRYNTGRLLCSMAGKISAAWVQTGSFQNTGWVQEYQLDRTVALARLQHEGRQLWVLWWPANHHCWVELCPIWWLAERKLTVSKGSHASKGVAQVLQSCSLASWN